MFGRVCKTYRQPLIDDKLTVVGLSDKKSTQISAII